MATIEPFKLHAVKLPGGFRVVQKEPNRNDEWLGPLSRLNVLIGPNNSGKSRLLRALMRPPAEAGGVIVRSEGWSALEAATSQVRRHLETVGASASSASANLSELASKVFGLESWVLSAGSHEEKHVRLRDRIREMVDLTQSPIFRNQFELTNRDHASELTQALREAQGTVVRNMASPLAMRCIYVPALRSMRLIPGENPASKSAASDEELRNDPLSLLASRDYDLSIGARFPTHGNVTFTSTIHSGQSLYAVVQRRLLGSYQDRTWVKRYEAYLSERFFQGQQVSLIPRIGQPMHIKIADAAERPLSQLGDGLQQVVLLTYPYMLEPTAHVLLFIEEPELYLHPGFQRALIEAWLDYRPEVNDSSPPGSLQVFVATHSSQFLDLTLDRKNITVFRCAAQLNEDGGSERDTNIRVSRVGDDARCILADLGMRNSAVLLCNCTIWVEGITDRMYLRHWLDLYWQSSNQSRDRHRYLEDVHFAFIEYSGANITHWSFLDRADQPKGMDPKTLCGELFLIADQDDANDKAKSERHKCLEAALGERFWRLPVREIENLLSPLTIASIVHAGDDQAPPTPLFVHDDYKDKPLGRFIDEHIPLEASTGRLYRSRGYADRSGTIRDKRGFAERAIRAMRSWDDVSLEAQELVSAVASFIEQRNP